jgi:hypothetical protein
VTIQKRRAGKKKTVKNKTTVKKKTAKKKTAAKRPSATKQPQQPVQLFSLAATTTTVSDDVVSILEQQFTVSQSQASSKKLSDMVAGCGTTTLTDLARALNAQWATLDPKFAASDLSCSDTADTVAVKVNQRLP